MILAHRLLENSVPSDEYLLMSEPAYRDLGAGMELAFSEDSETYDEFGTIPTYVHLMTEATERMRDSFYAMEPVALASRGRGYARMSLRPHFSAVIDQLRHPSVSVGWPKRVAFALGVTIASPVVFVTLLFTTPRKLLAQRAVRAATGAAQNPAA